MGWRWYVLSGINCWNCHTTAPPHEESWHCSHFSNKNQERRLSTEGTDREGTEGSIYYPPSEVCLSTKVCSISNPAWQQRSLFREKKYLERKTRSWHFSARESVSKEHQEMYLHNPEWQQRAFTALHNPTGFHDFYRTAHSISLTPSKKCSSGMK